MADDDTVDDGGADATRREGPGARKPREDPDQVTPGTHVGRYVVIDVIGAGGMGVVYSAFDPELDRKVAIKLLQARPGGSQSGGQTWLVREAQAMARLAHPNVVAIYDVGVIPGDRVFLAMELVDGTTLRSWLREKRRTWRECLVVMQAAGAGLAAAHSAGLVHRDFKPDNVLVGTDGRVRVMDFGLARMHTDEPSSRHSDLSIESRSPLSERLTQTGALLGTPAYMAPEIYGGRAADAHADQFAFGVALYEALYRTRPFDRKALVEGHATLPKPPAEAKVPAWIERIVLRAIALDPAQRFATMDELLAALAKDPATTRRRIAAIGGGVVLAGIGIVVGAVALGGGTEAPAPAPPQVCTDAPAKLATAWNPTSRAALEAGFRKLGKPYVDDAIHGSEAQLDAYGTGWVAARTEACKATRVFASQTEEVLTLRMACLDDRLVELQTLVGLFAKADEPLVLASAATVQKLSSFAACADVTALLSPVPLPKDPAARALATSLHAKLVEARVVYKTARLDDTLAMLAALAPEAAKLQHLPTEAELHLLTGQALWVAKGAAIGEPELVKAALAADAGKADAIKVEAWLQLANLANEASHFDVAKERLDQASAALARLGANWDLEIRVLASQALLASRTTKHDEAVALATRARELGAKHPDSAGYTYALLVEASILTSAGRAPDALASFAKVLAAQLALGKHRIDVAVTLQTMASAELAVGKLDDAIAHLDTAREIAETIYGAESRDVAKILAALGAARSAKGDPAAGLATQLQALAIADKILDESDELHAFFLGQVADALVGVSRSKDAIPYLDRAIAIDTAKLGAGHVQTLSMQLTKCDALRDIGSLKEALAVCRTALATGEASLGKTSPMLFLFFAHTGMVLADAQKPADAAAMFDRSLALGAPDPSDVYFIAFLAAQARWAAGQHPRAIVLATKARDGFRSLGEAKAAQASEVDAWLAKHR